jgi:hypothetical protein
MGCRQLPEAREGQERFLLEHPEECSSAMCHIVDILVMGGLCQPEQKTHTDEGLGILQSASY